MDHNAINRVTLALKQRLENALRDLNDGQETVYVGPLDDPGNAGFKMLLYLYRVAVNADLRSAEHVVPPPQPQQPANTYVNSLPLDLYYLLTAGTSTPGGEMLGLTLLGRAMQALNDTPLLVGSEVQHEVVRVTLDPVNSDEMSRIWTLFPNANYRTSVVYLANPVWIDPALPATAGPPVVDDTQVVGYPG